jgi:8-oxo-dGTP pyrophosphatase MutT (NUDIX family)
MRTFVVAKVILVNAKGQILLLRRSASDVRRPGQWDIPGGHTDGNEFAEEAAARETKEEADITIDPRSLLLIGTETKLVEPDLNVNWLFYLAHTNQEEVTVDPAEHDDYRWVDMDEAIKLVTYERQQRILKFCMSNQLEQS